MADHTIRLRAAWEWHDPGAHAARRVSLPLVVGEDVPADFRLSRAFNAPPLDAASESLWLHLRDVPGLRTIRINSTALPDAIGAGPDLWCALAPLLRRNVIELTVEGAPAGTWGEIALVVRPIPPPSIARQGGS
jgi:hypothetical protein